MEPGTNIFEILNVRRSEDTHDRVVAWLCDANGGHGIRDLARAIVLKLWGYDCAEVIRKVHRQFKLRDDCWPDVAVEFETALLVIENRVNASALREGQLEVQLELARQRQGENPLFHCLLCPDRMADIAIAPKSDVFRVLRYSMLADLIEARTADLPAKTKPVVEQYAAFIRTSLCSPLPAGIKVASPSMIMSRNKRREPWDLDSFLAKATEKGGLDLASAQQELIDLLVAMEDVEPRFDSRGEVDPTYRVYLANVPMEALLWVYADGRIFVSWGSAMRCGRKDLGEHMKRVWREYLKSPENPQGSNTKEKVGILHAETIAGLLQKSVESLSS